MDTLEKLFGSASRLKLLKLFLMNPESQFSFEAACRQSGVRAGQFRAEVTRLMQMRLVRTAYVRLPQLQKQKSSKSIRLVRTKVFFVNQDFPLYSELRTLMLKSAPHAKGQLAEKIKRLGNIKLALLSGIFIDNPNARVDLLLVGDGFRRTRMNAFIRWLEVEFGKQLNYVAMSSQEFRYRMDMYDRFLRDILESPHEAVINKLGVGVKIP